MGQYSESFSSNFYEERRKCIKFDIQAQLPPSPTHHTLHSHILIKTHEYDYFSDLSIQYLVCTIKSLLFF